MVYKFVVLLWACKKGQFYVLNLFPNIQAEFDLGTRYNMSYLRDFTTKFMFIPVLSLKHVEEDLRSLETSLTRACRIV
uniref:Uncharacterized protein n=2 Tax=Zea mays TaxID=4577 RepID=C4IZB1_MAIZE|nr:unknown [Zea mays]